MKTLEKYIGFNLILLILLAGCSPKTSNERIEKLEGQEAVLEKTTELNKLRLQLEKNIVKQTKLTEDVEQINQQASASARHADELSGRVSRNPGDSRLANRANRASRRAAKDAKKSKKLNNQLEDVNNKIRDLRKDIGKTEKELSELKARIGFVPSN